MDREVVLVVLAAVGCGGALALAACCPPIGLTLESGRVLEQRAWRQLWRPFGPALLLLAGLCGWALVEPATAERVPACLMYGAVPFMTVLVRAAWRGARTLRQTAEHVDVGVVGLWHPRIVVSNRAATALDARALAAALAHERAHARHRDPVRIWAANVAADLMWPWPAGGRRLRLWAGALELARDEEARLGEPGAGVAGADLAAAVLGCLRLDGPRTATGAASLGGDASFLQERVGRLLGPVPMAAPLPSNRAFWCVALLSMLLAAFAGCAFGEHIVRMLFAVV